MTRLWIDTFLTAMFLQVLIFHSHPLSARHLSTTDSERRTLKNSKETMNDIRRRRKERDILLNFPHVKEVSVAEITPNTIQINWDFEGSPIPGYRVQYYKRESREYKTTSNIIPWNITTYTIKHLPANTVFTICVLIINDQADRETSTNCIKTRTDSRFISEYVGSTIGAILCLALIIVIVLLARRIKRDKKQDETEKVKPVQTRWNNAHSDYDTSSDGKHQCPMCGGTSEPNSTSVSTANLNNEDTPVIVVTAVDHHVYYNQALGEETA